MLIDFDIWLRKNGLSRYEFARRYKISQPFVSQLVNGKKKASPEMVEHLARITGLKKAHFRPDLYGGAESLHPTQKDTLHGQPFPRPQE